MDQGIDTFSILSWVNFILFLAAIIIPIWVIIKVNSIDKTLKTIAEKLDKRNDL